MKSNFWRKTNPLKPNLDFPLYPFFIIGRQDIIFIHIPKTAGTSIRKAFEFNPVNKKAGFNKHKDARTIISHLGEDKWKDSFKFSFVRNPWERLLSQYHYKLRQGKIKNTEHQSSFKAWAMDLFLEVDQSLIEKKNLQTQVQWLKDKGETINIDFIGRYENLQVDFHSLLETLSISTQLEHINQNPKKVDYRNYYDTELKHLISTYYEEDVEYFKYQF